MDMPRPNFIQQLQQLDEAMKRRLLIGATVVVMVGVVFVWVGYLNSIVMNNQSQLADQSAVAQPVAQPTAVAQAAPQNPPANVPGFWSMLGLGVVSAYHGVVNGIAGAGSAFRSPRQYDITPAQAPAQAPAQQ